MTKQGMCQERRISWESTGGVQFSDGDKTPGAEKSLKFLKIRKEWGWCRVCRFIRAWVPLGAAACARRSQKRQGPDIADFMQRQIGSKPNGTVRSCSSRCGLVGHSRPFVRALVLVLRVFTRGDAALLDLLDQCCAIQAEQAGGSILVPMRVFECLFDEIRFEAADDHIEVESR